MKFNGVYITSIFASVALAGVPGISTPAPVQPGFPDNCEGFTMAIPGDTCDSLSQKNGLDVTALLSLNPQIGGVQNCPQNVQAYVWYCVHAGSEHGDQGVAPPTRTSAPRKSVGRPPPKTTVVVVTETVVPIKTTPAPVCPRDNDCWRAFRKAADRVKPSYSSWCTSVLAPPAIKEDDYDLFPGAPNMVRNQCSKLGAAHTVISSYCSCYTAGQMD